MNIAGVRASILSMEACASSGLIGEGGVGRGSWLSGWLYARSLKDCQARCTTLGVSLNLPRFCRREGEEEWWRNAAIHIYIYIHREKREEKKRAARRHTCSTRSGDLALGQVWRMIGRSNSTISRKLRQFVYVATIVSGKVSGTNKLFHAGSLAISFALFSFLLLLPLLPLLLLVTEKHSGALTKLAVIPGSLRS